MFKLLFIFGLAVGCAKACYPDCFSDSTADDNRLLKSSLEDRRCSLPVPPEHEGPWCRMATESDFYYDATSASCVDAPWSECMPRGQGRGFNTLEKCETSCLKKHEAKRTIDGENEIEDDDDAANQGDANSVCMQPKKTGRCKAYFRRHYYDAASGECLEFVYGGCGSNGNNFKSKLACEQKCKPNQAPIPGVPMNSNGNICQLPMVNGPCMAIMPSFYYSATENRCIPFNYGGCMGNENRFHSLVECEQACKTE